MIMKRVKLTGSKSGFAPALIRVLSDNGYRARGYGVGEIDLEQPADVARIVSDADVFVNNANHGFSQAEILFELFKLWKDDPAKHIINISSRAAQPNISKGYLYAAQKAALEHLANNLTYNSLKKCKISTVAIGLMREQGHYAVPYTDVAKSICQVIESKYEIPFLAIQHGAPYPEVQAWKALRSADL
jgi:NADP-dependent 3-hydroxy acid dehydrogenase YdfG